MSAVQSSLNDVFRFVKLRAPNAQANTIDLLNTQYAVLLAATPTPAARQKIADDVLSHRPEETVRAISDLHFGIRIDSARREALTVSGATLQTVADKFPELRSMIADPGYRQDLTRLSDTLLLSIFGSRRPAALTVFRELYILYTYLLNSIADPSLLAAPLVDLLGRRPVPPVAPGSGSSTPSITAAGIADLLVVKQQIKRYEATEIAHVENIMSGETRSREHRSLERIEETLTVEKEKILEKEKELETSERFELNKEASRTIKEDQKYAFDLSVSANYGPTVEVETGFDMEIETSTESTSKAASKYAKDVVERSLERVKERVREERIRTIIRETEEKNVHSFINGADSPNKSGVYQFLDKVYEAQVFNYGKRQIFDLMVPEPASYLWYLNERNTSAAQRTLPEPPQPLTITANDILFLARDAARPNHYMRLSQKYGATALAAPPEPTITAFAGYQAPAAGSPVSSEEGSLLSAPVKIEIDVPAGYVPRSARLYCIASSDNSDMRRIPYNIGSEGANWVGTEVVAHGRIGINHGHSDVTFRNSTVLSSGSKLIVSAFPYETANYSIGVEITCDASTTLVTSWKLTTYDKLRGALADRTMEYKDELSKIQAEQRQQQGKVSADFGLPPSKRKQLMITELKKHCIAIFMRNWFVNTSVAITSEVPRYDFAEAVVKGSVIRFLEQSIEWSQLQYALYPYFWARPDKWEQRLRSDDADYEFQQFMQAGAARVVLPVRPKFEAAFNHFLETGEVWNGTGEPPRLTDPLYVAIVDELRELSGGSLDVPVSVGDPWEVRLPTNLVLLRQNASLPEWREEPVDSWNWRPTDRATT